MVLVHGHPETWWEWRHVMPIFASAGFRVIAVDYRGAGNSSKPAGGYDKRTISVRSVLDWCQIVESLTETFRTEESQQSCRPLASFFHDSMARFPGRCETSH